MLGCASWFFEQKKIIFSCRILDSWVCQKIWMQTFMERDFPVGSRNKKVKERCELFVKIKSFDYHYSLIVPGSVWFSTFLWGRSLIFIVLSAKSWQSLKGWGMSIFLNSTLCIFTALPPSEKFTKPSSGTVNQPLCTPWKCEKVFSWREAQHV